MNEFNKVTVIKKANIYFDGKVTSRTLIFPDGAKKTLGIMLPGDYTFNTDAAELMEILGGELKVQLAGQNNWQSYTGGMAFNVPAKSSFKLQVATVTDYCCSFLQV